LKSISVTRRSVKNSKALAESYPSLVSVHDDNQEILDKADLIFLCVLPQQTSQVLHDLSFDKSRHTLVSLAVSASSQSIYCQYLAARSNDFIAWELTLFLFSTWPSRLQSWTLS
jgi:pyrroline-5-carboxylate reductase